VNDALKTYGRTFRDLIRCSAEHLPGETEVNHQNPGIRPEI